MDATAAANDVIFPRKLLEQFILLYKEYPCLWNRSSVDYKCKHKRLQAISSLTTLVQQYDPTATRVHVLRKIESLRACVRREVKKVKDSREKASSPDEVYTPQLWYYDLLSFAFNKDTNNTPAVKTSSSPPPATLAMKSLEEEDESETNEASEQEETSFEQHTFPRFNVMMDMAEAPSSSKRYSPLEDEQRISKRLCTEVEDEYDAIGVNVAAKLRTLPPSMRILAEKLINDVLFQAQVNGLHPSTVITTTDPIKHDLI